MESARQIVPLILNLLNPRSVIDVGCGIGHWLSIFAESGIEDFVGIDGTYIDRGKLVIPDDKFLALDLTRPTRLDRSFDLVISLEVAEHLPSDCASTFIESLIRLGPVVMFSAAIPFQGGSHHMNEQWPDYWAALFDRFHYVAIDCLRHHIWKNDKVDWWYAQNLLLFVDSKYLAKEPWLQREAELTHLDQLSIVHPRAWKEASARMNVVRRLLGTATDLATVVPPGSVLILVDDDLMRGELKADYKIIPFLEKNGRYWGPPVNDESAIAEMDRLRQAGAMFIVFAWVAFWWLDHYTGFATYLRETHRCVLRNERLIVFRLGS